MQTKNLPKGIFPIIQTPFDRKGELDFVSLQNLIEDAIAAGCDGLICTGVAGEIGYLTEEERLKLLSFVFKTVDSRVPIIVGASSDDVEISRKLIQWSQDHGGVACLIQVPSIHYKNQDSIVPYFRQMTDGFSSPIVVQDFELNGSGMSLDIITRLVSEIPTISGIKIETLPSGPKYTAVKKALGNDFYVSGGWAVTQLIEALERGVDAMIPECAMVRLYKKIFLLYQNGNEDKAKVLFYKMLPILSFTNQEVGNSIKFFKCLLVEKGIFSTAKMRWTEPEWDNYSHQTARNLIHLYLSLEAELDGSE
ncbi:dihydrodipicolinate synthase family protein [Reichenbachiella sp. MALMAid0571]|uniref:dihydrodipicolinate synthase family protein n=1 Tax=Reichenbachiella sp. MALMAid0571 TaxID=3143939 RepID=UPI0032DF5AEC